MSPKGSILIVDDELEIRESLQSLLSLEGYRVEAVGTPMDMSLASIGRTTRQGFH